MNNAAKKNGMPMSSLKDAQHVLESGQSSQWGQVIEVVENKDRTGLGFEPGAVQRDLKSFQEVFHSAGFIHAKDHSTAAIIEDDQEEEMPNFVTHGLICQNWIAVDVPTIVHASK